MKVLFYGVREVEVPLFHELNKKFGYDLELIPDYLNSKETAEKAKGFECVVLRGNCFATKEVLDMYKEYGVKYLLTRTVGTNHIDVKYAKELGFKLAYVPFYSPNAIAELAVTHAMTLLRNIGHIRAAQFKGDFTWNKDLISKEIRSCTVGIIGTGRIGLTAATLFKGLGAKVIGFDEFRNPGADGILEYRDTVEALLEEADVVSLHLPLTDGTYHMINKDRIKHMKDHAILVNTGRGGLVNIDDVVEALESGKIKGAALDVLECETLYVNQKIDPKKIEGTVVETLMGMDNVVLTGHFAFFTETAVDNMVSTALDNLKVEIETGKVQNCMNA